MLLIYASYVNYSQPYGTSYDPHAVGTGGGAPPHARNAALPPDSLARSRLDCSIIALQAAFAIEHATACIKNVECCQLAHVRE